jgi:hypothetical protein
MSQQIQRFQFASRTLFRRRGAMTHGRTASATVAVMLAAISYGTPTPAQSPGGRSGNIDWPLHNLDLRNSRYSALDEINTTNVEKLALKWSYDAPAGQNISRTTPLVIDGVMFLNAGSRLLALDAATGQQRWTVDVNPPFPANGRGPTYGDGRVYAYGRSILYSVDVKTGKVDETFGNKGRLQVPEGSRCRAAVQISWQGSHRLPDRRTAVVPQRDALHRARPVGFAHRRRTGGGGRWPDRRDQMGVQHHPAVAGRRWLGDHQGHLEGRRSRGRRHVDAAGAGPRAGPRLRERG